MSAQWKRRKHRAERVAEEAWDHLVSALDSARAFGGTVRDRASGFAASDRYDAASHRFGSAYNTASDRVHTASDRVGAAGTEAWKRANRALDALSGRRRRAPWGWIAVAALGGVAVGWAIAAAAPKAIQAAQDRFTEEPDELPPPAAYDPDYPPTP
ncbi:hypothetical protein AB0M46_45560 [Dactylosporangium sp. NPDC051485]|uniref:hypothetical protein n=1 Tax=Dactylosporangium sp. NPDC051485 TaxID=3154846 RepID=UPI0034300141